MMNCMVSVRVRVLLMLTLGGVPAFPSWAQSVAASPEYTLSVQADGMPVNPDISLPIATRTITLTAQLTPQSLQAFPLLEPRSDDGFVNWNLLDAWITSGRALPVWRVR